MGILSWTKTSSKNLSASEIEASLNDSILGQEQVKKNLLVAMINFQKFIKNKDGGIAKNNILFIGPSGSGKTLASNCIARIVNIPAFNINCANLVRSGYVGQNLEDCQETFTEVCQLFYGEKAKLSDKTAIIFLDEIDKLSAPNSNSGNISTNQVQNQLLPLLDDNNYFGGMLTDNILFIGAGTFSDFYSKNNFDYSVRLKNIDAQKIGFSQELFSRFRQKIYLQKPDNQTIEEYLKSDRSNLRSLKNCLEMDGNNLNVSQETYTELVNLCNSIDGGIRGVDALITDISQDIMYESLFTKKKTFELDLKNYL